MKLFGWKDETRVEIHALCPMQKKSEVEKKYVVVVAEDEVDIRLIVAQALADAGFDVHEAEHAEDALAILQDKASDIHALFTDVNMPGSMDGVALAHHSRNNWPWIVLLISSGRPIPRVDHMPAASRFLPKPYHPDHVITHLHEMLNPENLPAGQTTPDQSERR